MHIQQAITAIQPLCQESIQAARERFSSIAIPLGSLGLLQEIIIQLAGIQRTVSPGIDKRAVVVFCADNGVTAQGVTQCGQEVTAIVTENISRGESSVCLMAKQLHIDVLPVDIGVAREVTGENIIRKKIRYGTADITRKPAMSRTEAIQAIEVGIAIAETCAKQGYRLLCTGEMGIGNTTTSAAIAAVLLDLPVETVTGRGAGLSSEGLHRKIQAIHTALQRHTPNPQDPLDILSKIGGLDIAGMIGLYLGGGVYGIPIVADGVISCTAALLASRLCPLVKEYIIASHVSAEPTGKLLLDALQKKTLITADMRLGEGTGAVAAVSLLDLALAVYNGMVGFDDIGITAYQPLS